MRKGLHFLTFDAIIYMAVFVVTRSVSRGGRSRMIELNFPNAVSDPRDFYGRRTELEQIVAVILSRGRIPPIVLGERRLGKTSLQNVTLRSVHEQGSEQFIHLNITPQGIKTTDEFALAVLSRLASCLGKNLASLNIHPGGTPFHLETVEQFEVYFGKLLDKDDARRYLLCVDEFDEIVRGVPAAEMPRLDGLITWLVERTGLPVTLFFTMTRPPEAMQRQIPSTLLAKAFLVPLLPWTITEIEQLLSGVFGDRLAASSQGVDWLFRCSGGHPYFTKLLLDHMQRVSPVTGPVKLDDTVCQDAAQRQALDDPRPGMAVENLYQMHFSDEEKALLLHSTSRGGRIALAELRRAGASWISAARGLVKRYYWLERDGVFEFRIDFLRLWLQNWIEFEEELERAAVLRHHLSEPVEIIVDDRDRSVVVRGQPVRLSQQEYVIMKILAANGNQIVDRDALVSLVWGAPELIGEQTVNQALYRLREKLQDEGQYIETRPGQGYILHRSKLIAGS